MPVILEDTGGTARTKVEQGVSIRELFFWGGGGVGGQTIKV